MGFFMGAHAWLIGCASREEAEKYDLQAIFAGRSGLELEANHHVPLFWRAAFCPEDALVVRREAGDFTVLYADTSAALAALRRRRGAVLRLVGEIYAPLYDAWIELLADHFPRGVLVRTESLFHVANFASMDSAIRRALDAFAALDRGEPLDVGDAWTPDPDPPLPRNDGQPREEPYDYSIRNRVILVGAATGKIAFPPPPSAAELDRVDPSGRATLYAELHISSLPQLAARVLDRIVEAVQASWAWAAAIPDTVLHALWARGERQLLWEIVSRLPPSSRWLKLAFFAALDPEPTGRWSIEALRGAIGTLDLDNVLAMIPLESPAVLAFAERAAKTGRGSSVLELRLGRGGELYEWSAGLPVLLAAEQEILRGVEGAKERLASVEMSTIPTLVQVTILDRLRLWPADETGLAAFVAARSRPDLASVLVADLGPAHRVAALSSAMLAVQEIPGALRDATVQLEETHIEELYSEGLLSGVERTQIAFARAACSANPKAAVDAQIYLCLTSAVEAAQGFVDGLLACSEGREAKRKRALRSLETVLKSEVSPHDLRKLRWAILQVADFGYLSSAANAVAMLEAQWGSPSTWKDDTAAIPEMLCCVPGRAIEAMEILDKRGDSRRRQPLAEVRLIAALVRDGARDSAVERLRHLLVAPLEPAAAAMLLPVARALDPDLDIERALTASIAELPLRRVVAPESA
jgi:hypothetical protein